MNEAAAARTGPTPTFTLFEVLPVPHQDRGSRFTAPIGDLKPKCSLNPALKTRRIIYRFSQIEHFLLRSGDGAFESPKRFLWPSFLYEMCLLIRCALYSLFQSRYFNPSNFPSLSMCSLFFSALFLERFFVGSIFSIPLYFQTQYLRNAQGPPPSLLCAHTHKSAFLIKNTYPRIPISICEYN